MTDPRYTTHGAFSWNELMTTDPAAAKAFYAALFGWEYDEMPMDAPGMEGQAYSVVKVKGTEMAGIMGIPPQAAGIPPNWGAYVTVDDVDATAKKVLELGGTILVPATDIPKVGRFLVLRDPQGAVLMAISYAMPAA